MFRITLLALAISQAAIADPNVLLDRSQIEHSGAHDLSDLLRQLPQLPAGTQGRYQLDLRGVGAVRSVLLIDGERLPVDPATGIASIPALPLTLIERVEWTTAIDAPLGAINVVLRESSGEVGVSLAGPGGSGDQHSIGALTQWSNERWSVDMRLARSERDAVARSDIANDPPVRFANDFLTAISSGQGPLIPGSPLRHPSNGSSVPGGCTLPGYEIRGSGSSQTCTYDADAVSDAEPDYDESYARLGASFDAEDGILLRAVLEASQRDVNLQLAPTTNFNPTPLYSPSRTYSLLLPSSPNHPARRFPSAGYSSAALYVRHRFAGLGPRQEHRQDDRLRAMFAVERTWGDWHWQSALHFSNSDYHQVNTGEVEFFLAQRAIEDGTYDIYTLSGPALSLFGRTLRRDAEATDRSIRNVVRWRRNRSTFTARLDYWREQVDDTHDRSSVAGTASSPRLGAFGVFNTRERRDGVAFGLDYGLEGDGWSSAMSIQHERRSDIDSESSALFRLDAELADKWRGHALVSSGIRAPEMRLQGFTPVPGSAQVVDPLFDDLGLVVTFAPQSLLLVPNPELDAERMHQILLGVRWQPSTGLQLGADFWQQQIDGAIRMATPTEIVICSAGLARACPPTRNLPPITEFSYASRRGLGVLRDRSNNISLIQTGYANLDTIRVRGADLSAQWQHEFGNATLRQSALIVYSDDRTPDVGGFANWRARVDSSIAWSNWRLGWTLNYIGPNDRRFDDGRDGSHATHDLAALWRAPWNGEFTAGVENLFDRAPPTLADYNLNLYDAVGRTPFVRYVQRW